MISGLHFSKIFLVTNLVLVSGPARAQLTEDFHPPRSNCCLVNTAKGLADQLQDWNQLGRYHQANQELMKQPPQPGRVVFLGDSITDFWKLDESFPAKPYVNRGISGQTTPQMLVRFRQDVIALSPKVVVILAGTNDIAGNTGPIAALNAWLKTYAAQSGCVYLDYARAMTDGRGLLQRDLADDGLHPNKAGYAVIAPLAEAAIAAALASPSSPQTSVCYK
jgi:lysophospholipase L1-like esterase